MKTLLTILSLTLLPASSFGAAPKQFLVDLKVYMGGKLMSHPRVVLNSGTKGEISDVNEKTGKGQFIEVTAHAIPDDPDQAFLQLVIGKIEKGGRRTVIGTPQLSAMLKEESVMEIEENGKQVFKIAATVFPEGQAARAPAKKAGKKK